MQADQFRQLLSDCLILAGDQSILVYDSSNCLIEKIGPAHLVSLARADLRDMCSDLSLALEQGAVRQVNLCGHMVDAVIAMRDGWTLVSIKDVTTHIRRECDLRALAESDHLTGLLNRRGFERAASHILHSPLRQGHCHIVGAVDADNLKSINQEHGYAAGDSFLKSVATRLSDTIRENDCVGRIGGDELAFCISDVPAERATELIQRFFHAKLPRGTFSIGAITTVTTDVSALLYKAGELLNQAKTAGKNRFAVQGETESGPLREKA